MSTYTQEKRSLSVTTPLGPDVLMLQSFSGNESISRLFRYHLDLASEKEGIAPKGLVGKGLTWSVRQFDKEPRFFHGVVSRFVAGPRGDRGLWTYRLEVVPSLWFLTRTADCRIFQNKNTPDIIKTVFDDFGIKDTKLDLQGTYPKREYCVQYRETAFNFVSRLMEFEGIFYYFHHEDGKHTLVLADRKSTYSDCPEAQVKYSPGDLAPNHIHSWEHQYEFRPGKWARTDYNFKTPSTNLLTNTSTIVDLPGVDKYEIFDYPGDYYVKGDGEPVTKVRMEEVEAGYEVVQGASLCCTFTPCGKFTLENHDVPGEIGSYVITSIQHRASEASYGATTQGADYSNTFSCIRSGVTYRPERLTLVPQVKGPQTAVVVGPAGEEIYVDKYGRIKVQFFWDRKGKKDENSSCWIRVSEQWAGKNWGFVANPRLGQEVIVDFLEGDPDRPLVTGRVYNAEQMPPYDLPGNMTQTGIKSRSSKGGSPANFNEIRFEDKKGSELVNIHAEKDQSIEVEHDESHWVGHDRTKNIDHDETTHVKHDRTETVDNNETITVHGQRTETVDKNETIAIHMNRTETVDMNESITVSQSRTRMVTLNESVTVGVAQEITVGGLRSVTVGAAQTITVGAAQTITVGASQSISVGGDETETYGKNHTQNVTNDQSVTVGKNGTYKIGESRATEVGKEDVLKVGKEMAIDAGERIVLKTGDAEIEMKKDGTINIKGKEINFQASGKFNVKADSDITMKGQNILQN